MKFFNPCLYEYQLNFTAEWLTLPGVPGFKFLPGDQISCLRYLVVFCSVSVWNYVVLSVCTEFTSNEVIRMRKIAG
jgi:hypothetical protein